MNGNRNQTITLVAATTAVVGLVVCAIVLMRQDAQVAEILERQQALDDRISPDIDSLRDQFGRQAQSIAELGEESAALRTQLTSLSRYVSRSLAASNAEQSLATIELKLPPGLLASGIYILDTEVGGDDNERTPYTLYHLTATVRAADREFGFQFGVARSGFFSWQIYFDYDNDGLVDTDMVREFVGSIPFGGYVSGSFDPERSQAIYDRFLASSGDADYIPPEQIEEQSNEIVQGMWSFVTDSSAQLANWIWSRAEADANTGAERPSVQ
jgi:hypothetical protein